MHNISETRTSQDKSSQVPGRTKGGEGPRAKDISLHSEQLLCHCRQAMSLFL